MRLTKRFTVISLSFLMGLSLPTLATGAELQLCALAPELYDQDIQPKIEAGIPFELLVEIAGDQVLTRKLVRIRQNLWDETLDLRTHDTKIGTYPLKSAKAALCSALSLEVPPKGSRVRLLLNPMWSERLARLHLTTRADLENKRLVGIDWKRIGEELAGERVLLERGITP